MIGDSPEPILGIPIVRFTPMKYRVDQHPFWTGQILDEIVGFVVVIVIKKRDGFQKGRLVALAGVGASKGFQTAANFGNGEAFPARAWPELREFRSAEGGPKSGIQVVTG